MSTTLAAWMTFGISMLPLAELKVGIPFGVGNGLPLLMTYLIALLGSCLPAPFIIFFIEKILRWMQRSKVKFFNKFSNWLYGKVDKHRDKVDKFGYWGVLIFVAIPLPGTGVWTGSLIASVLGLKPIKSLIFVLIGNAIAGAIMLAFSGVFFHGLLGG